MGFGIAVTVSVSTNTDSPTECERSVQIGFWGPKRKVWASFLLIGENMKTIRKNWKLTPKEIKEKFTLEGFLSLFKSVALNAVIFTVGAFVWLLAWVQSGSLLSLYFGTLLVIGAAVYWNLWFSSKKPGTLEEDLTDVI